MDIKGVNIPTPYDAAHIEYTPDWRAEVAKAWAADSTLELPHKIRSDKWIAGYRDFLRGRFKYRKAAGSMFEIAEAWRNSELIIGARHRIEPLLLTGATYSQIAFEMDLGDDVITDEVIRTYERLFFNIRNSDGSLVESSHTRMYFSMPHDGVIDAQTPLDMLWKAAATQMGYQGLVILWHWPVQLNIYENQQFVRDEIMRQMYSTMLSKIFKREINNFDLNNLFGQYINQERLLHDTGRNKDVRDESADALIKILSMFKAEILLKSQTVDERKQLDEFYAGKSDLKKYISNQVLPVGDEKRGIEVLDQIIKERLK